MSLNFFNRGYSNSTVGNKPKAKNAHPRAAQQALEEKRDKKRQKISDIDEIKDNESEKSSHPQAISFGSEDERVGKYSYEFQ